MYKKEHCESSAPFYTLWSNRIVGNATPVSFRETCNIKDMQNLINAKNKDTGDKITSIGRGEIEGRALWGI